MSEKNAIKNVKHGMNQLESILSSLDTGLSVINSDHTISWVNQKIYEMFPGADPIGQICHRFYEFSNKPCEPCPTFQCFRDGCVQRLERYNPAKGRWYHIISQPIKDSNGQVVSVLEGITDITERKKEEIAIQQERKFLKKLLETSPVGIAVVNKDGQISQANSFAEKTLGLTRADIYNRSYNDPVWRITDFAGNAYPEEKLPFQIVKLTGEPVHGIEHAIEWPDGKRVLLSINAAPLFDNNGNFDGMVSVITDVTEGEQTADKLKESEKKYRLIAENMADIITTLDMNLRFTYISPSIKRLRGFTVKEALEQTIDQIMTPVSFQITAKAFEEELRLEATATADPDRVRVLELELYKKDGSTIWAENTLSFIRDDNQKPAGILVISRDITERRQAEETLRKNEALLREAQRVAKIGHWELDAPSGTPVWSEEIFHIFGLDPKTSEPSFAAHETIIHEADWPVLRQSIQDLSTGGISFDIEFRIVRPDGEIRWMRAKGSAEKGANGAVARMFGTAQDITDHKTVEEALSQSRERFSLAMEATKDGIWDWNLTSGDIYCSPGLTAMLGYEPSNIIENVDDWQNLIYSEDRQKAYQANLDCVNGLTDSFEVEYRMKTKGGTLKWILGRGQAVRDASGKAVRMIGTHQDITEKKQTEEALRQAHKREATGTLAGGIAHEFNNMLGIIIGNTELAIDDIPEWNPAADCIQEIRSAALRAKDVVRKLLSVARKTPESRKPVNIRMIIDESLELLRKTIPASIDIHSTLVCTTEMISADPADISQVLINLCTNSVHAMDNGKGVLEVALENITLTPRSAARFEDIGPGDYVRLKVSDDGEGISPDIIDRIFDPYFTTKDVDEGLGMGLAVVQGIVKKHDGAIKIESEIGQGTITEVLFPRIEEPPVAYKQEAPLPTGTERILFVDDETSLVKMVTQMLTRAGYEVIGKTSSTDALKTFRQRPESFDLVISDMTMPEMTGDELAMEVIQICPDMPIIICTGHSERMDEEKARGLGIKAFAMKPLTKSGLIKTVRKILDQAKAKAVTRY